MYHHNNHVNCNQKDTKISIKAPEEQICVGNSYIESLTYTCITQRNALEFFACVTKLIDTILKFCPKAIKFDLSLTFPLNAPFVKVRHIKRELV